MDAERINLLTLEVKTLKDQTSSYQKKLTLLLIVLIAAIILLLMLAVKVFL
jgi:hypothetical protein